MTFMLKHAYRLFLLLSLLIWGACCHAHQMSTAYLNLSQTTESTPIYLQGQLQVRWFDLELAIGLDANADGELSWAEVDARSAAIKSFAFEHISISRQQNDSEQLCHLTVAEDIQTDMHFDEGYLVLSFVSDCVLPDSTDQEYAIDVNYSAIFAQDADHKLLVNAELFAQHFSGVIDAQNHSFSMEPENNPLLKVVSTYIYQGILHIFKGTDHILFLCALLLTCVLYRRDKQWHANTEVRKVIKHTAWIITAFTLAHSLTLTATAMDLIVPSSHWVELGIALSVMLTALNNIWPLVLRLG